MKDTVKTAAAPAQKTFLRSLVMPVYATTGATAAALVAAKAGNGVKEVIAIIAMKIGICDTDF